MGKTTQTSPGDAALPGARPKRFNKKKTLWITPQLLVEEDGPVNTHWRTFFLDALVATSNVTAACKTAGVATSRAYQTRQGDPAFAAQWQSALVQGYDHLEMELLAYLRNPDPDVKMDVAGAIRLLTMHRETVARQRAVDDRRSEREVLESLDAMIEAMRQRRLANTVTVALPSPDRGQDI